MTNSVRSVGEVTEVFRKRLRITAGVNLCSAVKSVAVNALKPDTFIYVHDSGLCVVCVLFMSQMCPLS